jgi:tetratricopeptide (TPR) repeat protein
MSVLRQVHGAFTTFVANIYRNWGETFVQRGQNLDAIKICSRSLRLNPDAVDAYVQRGRAYLQYGDYDRALVDFAEALNRYPHRNHYTAEIYTWYGLTHYYNKDLSEAIIAFNIALHINPLESMAYVYRGMTEQAYGNFPAAIHDFTHAIHTDKENFIAYRHRGDAHVHNGNLKAAIGDYIRYIEVGTLHNARRLTEIREKINQLQLQLAAA